MKRIGMLFSVLMLAGGLAFAQQPSTPGQQDTHQSGDVSKDPAKAGDTTTPGKDTKDKDAKAKKEFTADVVSVDSTANTITVKKTAMASTGTEPGAAAPGASMADNETLTVDAKAQSSLKQVNAGDRVKLQCKTDDAGKQIVTKISRVDTRPASGEKP